MGAKKKPASVARQATAPRKLATGPDKPETRSPAPSAKHKCSKNISYASVISRQRAVQRAQRDIWQALENIIEGIIKLATAGNHTAAKFLFDFAGAYSLPPLDESLPKPKLAAEAASEPAGPQAARSAAELFFEQLGIQPPALPDDTAGDLHVS